MTKQKEESQQGGAGGQGQHGWPSSMGGPAVGDLVGHDDQCPLVSSVVGSHPKSHEEAQHAQVQSDARPSFPDWQETDGEAGTCPAQSRRGWSQHFSSGGAEGPGTGVLEVTVAAPAHGPH